MRGWERPSLRATDPSSASLLPMASVMVRRTYGRAPACSPPRPLGGVRARRRAIHHLGKASALPDAPAKLEAMDDAGKRRWREGVAYMTERMGMDEEKAEKAMVKAFGWGLQGYWRQSKVDETPDVEGIKANVAYLTETVGLDQADVPALVAKFPEVLGLSEAVMDENLEVLRKEWKMNDARVAATVKRKPQVLGNTLDCLGDCAGECNRCWARF